MANDAAGLSWSTATPVIGSDRRDGQQEIRGLRAGTGLRLAKEHIAPADSSVGGEHIKGSAVAFLEATMSARVNRPDDVTALSAQDDGRIGIDSATKILYYYEHAVAGWTTLEFGVADSFGVSIKTAFLDGTGWTNSTGKQCLVNWAFQYVSGSAFAIEVEDSASVFRQVSGATISGTFLHYFGSALVPAGKKIRLATAQGGVTGDVFYQTVG